MNEIEELENILDMILQAAQEAIQSGETLSPQLQDQIAEEIMLLTQEIDELHAQEEQKAQQQKQSLLQEAESEQAEVAQEVSPPIPPASPPTGDNVPPLDAAPHPSSNISKFRYDPQSKKLFVQFLGKHPNPNGPVYSYQGVPENIFKIFQRGAVGPRTSGKNKWHTWKQDKLPSHGAAMYQLIREGGYPYERVT